MANTMVYTVEETTKGATNGNAEALAVVTTSPEKPRRNLTKDFALCMEKGGNGQDGMSESESKTPLPSKADSLESSTISPASVIPAVVQQSVDDKNRPAPYHFELHPSLRLGLSQALVDRVSFYGIIHDINKEASSMGAHDPTKSCQSQDHEETKEESSCALVRAAVGSPNDENGQADVITNALIDEEAWLLKVVEERDPEEWTSTDCPPTFLQAMGEREYENPLHALSGGSRTQLWKPSRSWWEAKSGKNPWIEPSSHNKRWRYLWPLIHYHKFLAKCIKKLKRNGVDVKHAVSPVAVFLRDEVCAVSDHLAECSRFDSDEWMGCLKHFDGWTDCEGEDQLRQHIRLLKLRPLSEPGDVDSKLLRDQVDRHFLTAMAKARAQLREGGEAPIIRSREGSSRPRGQPPVYPRHALNPEATPVSRNGYRRNSSPGLYNYHDFNPYWNTGDQSSMSSMVTQPSAVPYGDNSSVQSVQSVLSSESGFVQNNYPAYMHPVAAHPHAYPHYYAGHMPYHHPNKFGEYPMNGTECIDPAYYGALFYPSYQTPMAHGIPSEVEEQHDEDVSEGTDLDLPSTSESEAEKKDSTPVKYQMQPQQQSPFWSHLDSVATGLATPAKASPKTPRQNVSPEGQPVEQFHHTSAQPLLLRGYPYYGNYMAREGYAPPSPATQFMMSPQPNFAPGYGYPYGLSPGGARSPRKKMSSRNAGETTPPPVRKIVATHDVSRESPTTVGTSAETESLPEGAAV